MAFDGSITAGLTAELNSLLTGGYISKISQPEKDALLLLIKNNGGQYRLFLSASASLPLIYLTEANKKAPLTAPSFCMLLRKHLGNAKILGIKQPALERVIEIETEHLDEMGDVSKKSLIIELMGKYSNIILVDEERKMLDGIKHITALVSSVREVLPNRPYFVPAQEGRLGPFLADRKYFDEVIRSKPTSSCKAIFQSLIGFSPLLANEACFLAGVEADYPISSLNDEEADRLFSSLSGLIERLRRKEFSPSLYTDEKGTPKEFSAFPLQIYKDFKRREFSSFSNLLEAYYGSKDASDRIRQKSSDLRRIISSAIERSANKIDIFLKQLKDTEKMEKFRQYGELILSHAYLAKDGDSFLLAKNYESGMELKIPLDKDLSLMENSQKNFEKYKKLKRTKEAVEKQLEETKEELSHLESIKVSLDVAENAEDLVEIKAELVAFGYMKKKSTVNKKGKKEKETKGKPLHFLSSDGFDIYVGKNNYQNDYITFKLANGGDWWFHVKNRPGSHVVLLTGGKEVPDRAFNEAASLAVHYSSATTSSSVSDKEKVEVDYVQRKEVKKPNGSKPGFVVYYTNYSLMADADISKLKMI